MVYDSLSVPEKVEYLRGVLPLTQFSEIEGEYDDYDDDLINELELAAKKNVKRQMDDWPDLWTILKEDIYNYSGSEIYKNLSLREIAYYESAMNNGSLETNVRLLEITQVKPDGGDDESSVGVEQTSEDELREFIHSSDIPEIKKAFSSVGNNIWSVLDKVPRMRIGEVEDDSHVYFDFWVKNSEETKFHLRRGEEITFPDLGEAYARVHLDDEIVEIRERGMGSDNLEAVKSTIEEALGNQIEFEGSSIVITDQDVRDFENLNDFVKSTHAEHSGRSVSRWTSDSEVSNDQAYPGSRPHNFKNMVFDITNVGRVTFRLSPAGNNFRIYQTKLRPEQHRETVEYIIDHLKSLRSPNQTLMKSSSYLYSQREFMVE
jgi:hypothetical protein